MNGATFTSNIKELKTRYIIQLILCGIIIISNFILFFEIFWLKELFYYLYFSLSFFCIIYFFVPICSLIFIKLKKLTQKNIHKFKKITFILCALVLITGFIFTAILMLNALDSSDFSRECPFNLLNSYINSLYNEYENNSINKNKLKDQCTRRRCLYHNEISDNKYPYEYVCNYDPTSEFASDNNNNTLSQIECIKIEKNYYKNYNFETEEIDKYIEMCNSFNEFYICQRNKKPKYYSLDEDYKCPQKNYLTYLIFFSMLSVLFNLIINFLTWRAIYIKYKMILKFLNFNNNMQGSTSLNSTQNVTKDEIENKEEHFEKEPTKTIVIYTGQNMMDEINKNEDLYINKINNKNIIANSGQIINDNKDATSNISEDSKKEDINSIKIFKLKDSLSNINNNEINNEIKNRNFIFNSCQNLSFELNKIKNK